MKSVPSEQVRPHCGLGWPMLLVIWAVIAGALHLVSYGVIYTEGEVCHGGFAILVGATVRMRRTGFRE